MRDLSAGYTSEVDTADEQRWCQILQSFDDANIYQTWSYVAVTAGREKLSHLILRERGDIVAIAMTRIARLPFTNVGIAYIRWGPLWRRGGVRENAETFRQAFRALRNEYACRRGLVLRVLPILFDRDSPDFSTILAEEGFSASPNDVRGRTILMDLSPSLQELRDGMNAHWKRELKVAERKMSEVVEGSDDELFKSFIDIHREMVTRKRFVEGNDINQFRRIQAGLPERLKMKIMLCRSSAGIAAGLVYSAIGRTAVYLFGATSNIGMKSNGSYLMQWRVIEQLKRDNCATYDLNGINPISNPGTYKFKNDLAGQHGKDVYFLGRFEARGSLVSHSCVELGTQMRAAYRVLRKGRNSARESVSRHSS